MEMDNKYSLEKSKRYFYKVKSLPAKDTEFLLEL